MSCGFLPRSLWIMSPLSYSLLSRLECTFKDYLVEGFGMHPQRILSRIKSEANRPVTDRLRPTRGRHLLGLLSATNRACPSPLRSRNRRAARIARCAASRRCRSSSGRTPGRISARPLQGRVPHEVGVQVDPLLLGHVRVGHAGRTPRIKTVTPWCLNPIKAHIATKFSATRAMVSGDR